MRMRSNGVDSEHHVILVGHDFETNELWHYWARLRNAVMVCGCDRDRAQ